MDAEYLRAVAETINGVIRPAQDPVPIKQATLNDNKKTENSYPKDVIFYNDTSHRGRPRIARVCPGCGRKIIGASEYKTHTEACEQCNSLISGSGS